MAERPIGSCRLVAALAVVVLLGGAAAVAQEPEPAILAPLAPASLLLDGDAAGGAIVAVGERGHVLVSRDDGRSWVQKPVPVRATLTAVHMHDDRLGWAVGHDAVILRTRDGGETWEIVFRAPEEERPFLDVWFRDESNGFAIGAYGFFLVTTDGGDTWAPREIVTADEDVEDEFYGGPIDYHLDQLSRSDTGRLYIAAEAGTIYRSDDGGETWSSLPSPYEGTFFGSLPLEGDVVLMFGLRGHMYRSEDAGASWTPVETSTTAMLTDGLRLRDGTIVVAGLSGTLLFSDDGGASFSLIEREDRLGISSILESEDGGLILVGEGGARRVDRP